MSSLDTQVKAIEWTGSHCRLLDQRLLPNKIEYIDYDTVEGIAKAIKDMVVRGAPAIGITAAYGIVLAARRAVKQVGKDWCDLINEDLMLLAEARPTAVNLHWAIEQMRNVFVEAGDDPETRLLQEAIKIHNDDIAANKAMGDYGAEVIGSANTVMTHCNAGALATGGYGTALGVIRSLYANKNLKQVYAGETRPWLQGARLTSWELQQDNIPVTLISDTAASHLLSLGEVDWIVVGSDRIAANGDAANKIGTYQLAISAKHHGVKFMVAAPLSTIDLNTDTGKDIVIEQRPQAEVLQFAGQQTAPENVAAFNPVFDVTPASLIDAIVTEKGIVMQPDVAKIRALFS